jgi:predicted nuclease of predicted toxin-antitoxin system
VRILLDECVHSRVKAAFPGYAVKTVSEICWRSSKDGALLDFAQKQFDVFVTIDRKLEQQHNVTRMKMGFVVVRVPSNEIGSYRPIFSELKEAAERVARAKSSALSIRKCGTDGNAPRTTLLISASILTTLPRGWRAPKLISESSTRSNKKRISTWEN